MSEAKVMTAAARASPAIEGVRSLEVRWILPGQVGTAIAEWFGRFPAEVAVREDSYLLDPDLGGLSVKLRAGRALEVKAYHGSPGVLHAGSHAHGRMESWRKWSFPVGLYRAEAGRTSNWTVVRKSRRISRFWLDGEDVVPGVSPRATESACAVELTDVRSGDEAWWTLGFEATGPPTSLPRTLESTAALMFSQAPPDEAELRMSQCQSYAEWLFRRRLLGSAD